MNIKPAGVGLAAAEHLGGETLYDRETERQELLRALASAQREARDAQTLARLTSAMLAGDNVEKLCAGLLRIFADVAGTELAVLRVREGDRLRPRAAIGLEEEISSGITFPLGDGLPRNSHGTVSGDHAQDLPLFALSDDRCRGDVLTRLQPAEVLCFPLHEPQGTRELIGVVLLASKKPRIIDEDKELLAALTTRASGALSQRLHVDKLQHALLANQDVLGVVAHDLRNPINVIGMAANILLTRMPDSTARRPVERILRGTERANRLIQDLLAINAIEGGRFSIEKRVIETVDTVLASLESQQNLVSNASIIIATDLSPGLPPIECDEERLFEVLENLVGNAIKFTSPGGTVTVGAAARQGEILFWVKDNGSGIAAKDLPHLFDRFWQARKKDRRGTGLGLTICKAIVEAHGGRIWAESLLGQGTTLYFTIPSAPLKHVEIAQVANILLVDDRLENLLSLKAILERPEYRLVTATSGEEALKLALRENFAVALIDIAMPGMNGLEVATNLKNLERSRDIPIIFVTAFGNDPQEIHRAYSAGGADYLVKPLDSEIVRKKVAVFVDLSLRRLAGEHPDAHPNP